MDVKSTDFSGIFRAFTACGGDPKTFVFDVRPHKQFQKSHVALAYNVRVSANGQALLVGWLAPQLSPAVLQRCTSNAYACSAGRGCVLARVTISV